MVRLIVFKLRVSYCRALGLVERYAEKFIQTVYSTAHAVTGIDAMPRTAYMVRREEQERGAVVHSVMFDRWGRP
ncbi:hypothetical protein EB835_10645 [Brevibacterium sp. S22]|nr:hypothetical protein EB835_10645 [Brevibacterium sp. S22]